MRVTLLSLVLCLLASSVPAAETRSIVILGDSLSAAYNMEVAESWPSLLQARLERDGYAYGVFNSSIAGDTTQGGLARLPRLLERERPAVVIVELGGNDGLRGFPPGRMKSNLDKIIRTGQGAGADVVMLAIRIPPNYGQRYTEAFEAVFRELADEHDVPWLEFFLEGVALNPDLMQADGIHPNAAAQPILLDNAWPVINQALDKD